MSLNFQMTVELELVTCYSCAVVFGVPESWDKQRRRDHNQFFCPNGHSQFYSGKSVEEKLRDDLTRERAALDQAKAALATAERKVKRTERGICPHCNRNFANVARHMKSKHAAECKKL